MILFHLPKMTKQAIADQAKLEGLSVTGLLNRLAGDYITGKLEAVKQALTPKRTGRGNRNKAPEDLAKKLLREVYPGGIRAITLAKYISADGNEFTQAQAMRILDNLSGNTDQREYDFLVYYDPDAETYIIARDDLLGIKM